MAKKIKTLLLFIYYIFVLLIFLVPFSNKALLIEGVSVVSDAYKSFTNHLLHRSVLRETGSKTQQLLILVKRDGEKSASLCVLPACVQSRWAPALWGRNGADLT